MRIITRNLLRIDAKNIVVEIVVIVEFGGINTWTEEIVKE